MDDIDLNTDLMQGPMDPITIKQDVDANLVDHATNMVSPSMLPSNPMLPNQGLGQPLQPDYHNDFSHMYSMGNHNPFHWNPMVNVAPTANSNMGRLGTMMQNNQMLKTESSDLMQDPNRMHLYDTSVPSGLGQPMMNHVIDHDLRFSAEDMLIAIQLVEKQPELSPTMSDIVECINDGRKGRHDLHFFYQSRGITVKHLDEATGMGYGVSTGSVLVPMGNPQAGMVGDLVQDQMTEENRNVPVDMPYPDDMNDPIDFDDHLDEFHHDESQMMMNGSPSNGQSSSNTGIRGITWQESRCSYQASVCISLKQIYKIFSAKRVGKDKALEQAKKWLQEMRTRRDNGESLESLMKAGLFARKVSNTGIRGITWQESRMKFQCSIYMEKGRRVQKYFPTGLNRSGPRYEEAFRKAKEWTRKMEMKKQQMMQQNGTSSFEDTQYDFHMMPQLQVPAIGGATNPMGVMGQGPLRGGLTANAMVLGQPQLTQVQLQQAQLTQSRSQQPYQQSILGMPPQQMFNLRYPSMNTAYLGAGYSLPEGDGN